MIFDMGVYLGFGNLSLLAVHRTAGAASSATSAVLATTKAAPANWWARRKSVQPN